MSTLQENLDAIKLDKDTNLKPENLKKDVTCLGVTGTYEGSGGGTVEGIKQFATEEEMQDDPTAEEGDLAVVYKSEIQNATVDSHFQTATFPDTVVLDTAITDYVDIMYRATDSSAMFACWGQLVSSRFDMKCYTESGSIRIQYTSSDGITYTRTDTIGNPVDFGTEIYYERAEYWNDAIGKFIQVGGSTFGGLFVGESIIKQIQPIKMSTMTINAETGVPNISDVITLNYNVNNFAEKIYPMVKYIDTLEGMNSHSRHPYCIYLKDNNTVSIIADGSSSSSVMLACPVFVNNTFKGLVAASYNVPNFYEWQFNLSTGEYIGRNDIVATDYTTFGSSTSKYYYTTEFNDYYYIGNMDWTGNNFNYLYSLLYNNTSNLANTLAMTGIISIVYFLAPTQLTLNNPNELLPGKIAYGKNGVIVGDTSIYDNLNKEEMFLRILGMKKQLDETSYCVYDTTLTPYTIGPYEIDTAKYISETTDMKNADYVLGSLIDYKTLQDITNISGVIYSKAYFAKSSADNTYFIFVQQAEDNTYHILQIDESFTKIIDDISVEGTDAYCDICANQIMMLRVTDSTSETPYKYVVFNFIEKELVTLIPASTNSYTNSTIYVSNKHLVITNNKNTYLYDITHNTVINIGETENYLKRTDVFMFDTFIYIAKTTNDNSTITRKLYKYNDLTQTVELYATYTGGSYLSMYSNTIQTGMTCVETDTYILDYGRNIVYAKGNLTSSDSSITYAHCNIDDITFSNALYYYTDSCIGDNINYTFSVPNTSAITVTNDTIENFTYSIIPSGFGKRFKKGTTISKIYDEDTETYKLQSFEFNYSNSTSLYNLVHFSYSGYNAYAEYNIKYYDEVLDNPDYMLLKTSFKANENMSISPYLKLLSLKPVAISQEEYTEALTTVDEILGEEV